MAIRLHLTSDDIANIRFCPDPQPMCDVVTVIALIHRGRRAMHPQLDLARFRLLSELAGRCTPGFASNAAGSLDEGLEALIAAPAQLMGRDFDDVAGFGEPVPRWAPSLLERRSRQRVDLAAAYRHVYKVLIEPFAVVTAEHYQRTHRLRTGQLATDGLSRVLNDLHPCVRWKESVLFVDVASRVDFDVQLSGQGLELRPMMYSDTASVTHDELGVFSTKVMYPVAGRVQQSLVPPSSTPSGLAGLMGQTRASVLMQLAREPGATTSAIAAGLDVSSATASEHVSLLRAAGLARRTRRGPAVSHSLTPLGWSLLTASRLDPATHD